MEGYSFDDVSNSHQKRNQASELCPICKTYDLDCVKSGRWAYDMICGVCIERKAIYESSYGKISLRDWRKTYHHIEPSMEEVIGLTCLVDAIKKECRKIKPAKLAEKVNL